MKVCLIFGASSGDDCLSGAFVGDEVKTCIKGRAAQLTGQANLLGLNTLAACSS